MSSAPAASHTTRTNLDYSPAGSSGGTGAGIAAGYARWARHDTGGSIRGPSTNNGIVGLKPRTACSRAPASSRALSFDTGGPMARTVTDLAISLNRHAGAPDRATTPRRNPPEKSRQTTPVSRTPTALKGARIGSRVISCQDAESTPSSSSRSHAMSAGCRPIDVLRHPSRDEDGALQT